MPQFAGVPGIRMKNIRLGVMGCSSFAQRAMLPALAQCDGIQLIAVASRTLDRARAFVRQFGAEAVEGYGRLLERPDIDAVYMPLPAGLHREWGARALEAGKHLLVEKPLAVDYASAVELADLAKRNGRLMLENFHFTRHRQYGWVTERIASGALGRLHLLRATFGFPPLPRDNFRYDAALGGGALADAGTYTVKAARLFLGDELALVGAVVHMDRTLGVDIYGEAQFLSQSGETAQLAFGFDYYYQCQYELLGTKGKLFALRAFTAAPGLSPVVRIERPGESCDVSIPADNAYANMWAYFRDRIRAGGDYRAERDEILGQARLLDEIRTKAIRR